MEDVKVVTDGSVRNAFGNIFQFAYGEDGFDASLVEGVRTNSGDFTSFINIKRAAGKINSKYGYATPGDPNPVFGKTKIEKKEVTFTKPYSIPDEPIPVLGVNIKVGNKVNTGIGEGIITEINGDRVLVRYNKDTQYWVKTEKITF